MEEIEKLRTFIAGLESKLFSMTNSHGQLTAEITSLRNKQALLLEMEAMEAERYLAWQPSL